MSKFNKKVLLIVLLIFLPISLLLIKNYVPKDTKVNEVQTKFVRIATASISGVYYSTGNAVCRFIKKQSHLNDNMNIFCSVQSTPGAMYNLNALRNGDVEIAIAQGDWEYQAFNALGVFKQLGPMTNLRSMFTTHREALTILVREDSGINSFNDIQGKIVNIGAPGTGVRGTIETVMKAKGWTKDNFKLATELNSSEQGQALCDGKIDVMLHVIGHPNGAFQEVTATCKAKFIPLDQDTLEQLLSEYPYYSYYEVPTKLYMGEDEIIPTIAVRSTFYTRSDFPNDEVYMILESVFNNFSSLKQLHPAFSNLAKSDLIPKETATPIHEGALQYYKKVGLIQDENNSSSN
jgi:TRAP transporter TAXI family solute receptor